MELSPDIEMILASFSFGLSMALLVFYKLCATVSIKKALMKH